MKLKVKIIAIIAAVFVVAGVITLCVSLGKKSGGSSETTSASETVSSTERETNSESEETSASETWKPSEGSESDSVSASENESEEISESESAEESESNSENESESAEESESNSENESESVHTHKYNKEVATDKYKVSAATCYKKAKYYYSCECGEAGKETFEAGSFAPHVTVVLKGRAATCTESGLTDGKICGVCNKVLEAQNIVPALGHNLVHHEAKEIYNCYDYWWDEYDDCTRCDYSTKNILPPSHKYVKGICSVCLRIEPTDEKYFTVEDLEDGTCSISANSEFKEDYPNGIIIPSTINGKTVTKIGGFGYSDVKQIIIPDTVTEIAAYAFEGSNLESVYIPDSVTIIGESAFTFCSNLANVNIGNGVTVIDTATFSNCADLRNVNLGNSITTIKAWAFYASFHIESLTIPQSVTKIETNAVNTETAIIDNLYYSGNLELWFAAISGENKYTTDFFSCAKNLYLNGKLLSEVVINDVTIIKERSYCEYSWITSVVISDTVTEIQTCAFWLCENLSNVEFKGTMDQWLGITFGNQIFDGTQVTVVKCSDGDVSV